MWSNYRQGKKVIIIKFKSPAVLGEGKSRPTRVLRLPGCGEGFSGPVRGHELVLK